MGAVVVRLQTDARRLRTGLLRENAVVTGCELDGNFSGAEPLLVFKFCSRSRRARRVALELGTLSHGSNSFRLENSLRICS
jgi:hypothetical protein